MQVRRCRLESSDSAKSLISTDRESKKVSNNGDSAATKTPLRTVTFKDRASVRLVKPSFTLVESDSDLWYGRNDYQYFKHEIMANPRRLVKDGTIPEEAFTNFIRLDKASRETTNSADSLRGVIANSYVKYTELVGYERVIRQVACNSLVRRSKIKNVLDDPAIHPQEKSSKCHPISLPDRLYASYTAMALRVSLLFEEARLREMDCEEEKQATHKEESKKSKKSTRSSSKKKIERGDHKTEIKRSSSCKELKSGNKKKNRELRKTASSGNLKLGENRSEIKPLVSEGNDEMTSPEHKKLVSSKSRKSRDASEMKRSSSCKDLGGKKKTRELRKSSSTGSLHSRLKKSGSKRASSTKALSEEPATAERRKLSKEKESKSKAKGSKNLESNLGW